MPPPLRRRCDELPIRKYQNSYQYQGPQYWAIGDGVSGFFAGLGNAYISKWRWWKGIHFFNKEDIAEVYFEGYVDVSEEEAQRIFSEQENEIEYPKFRVDKTFEENS